MRTYLPDMEEEGFLARMGGLMAYGPNENDNFNRLAALSDRILNGTKPADLPLELPTRFHLTVNLRTAHNLGLAIPDSILARADGVIE